MTYEQALNLINSRLKFGIKPGLERISNLMSSIGNPEKKLKFIHIAGTNGKGSISYMLASILKESGYKIGLFTSPYIKDFRERFQINNKIISKKELIKTLESILPYIKDDLTEFEIITAIALKYFYNNKCDIVVLEVGLGGKLDATNIIENPIASIISSISLDHTNILGNSLEKITYEKCGIIKENNIIITYPTQNFKALNIIKKIATKKNSKLIIPNLSDFKIIKSSIYSTTIKIGSQIFNIPLAGNHQIENFSVVLYTLKNCFNISDENIINGLKNVKIPARLEVISKDPLIILDGAHNESGVISLKNTLNNLLKNKYLIGILGILKDKDSEKMLKTIAPVFSKIITTKINNPRSLSEIELKNKTLKYNKNTISQENICSSIKTALEISKQHENSAIIICGSLYLAKDIIIQN